MTSTNMRILICSMTLLHLETIRASGSTSCTVEDCLCDRASLLTTLNTHCGVQLAKSMTMTRPVLGFTGGQEGQKYLLLMLDPDAACYVHDIETVKLVKNVLVTDEEVVGYRPPNPPSGLHHYQLFLYMWNKTADDIVYDKSKAFTLSEFKEKNQLNEDVAVFEFLVASGD